MNLREFRECVEFNIEHGIRHAVLGLGAPGVGKSEIIKQIGEAVSYIRMKTGPRQDGCHRKFFRMKSVTVRRLYFFWMR